MMSKIKKISKKVKKSLTLAVIFVIRGYQLTFSPRRGIFAAASLSGCRYYPSCSDYAIDAISRDGLLKGCGKGVWRILRCNPWSQGGVDEP